MFALQLHSDKRTKKLISSSSSSVVFKLFLFLFLFLFDFTWNSLGLIYIVIFVGSKKVRTGGAHFVSSTAVITHSHKYDVCFQFHYIRSALSCYRVIQEMSLRRSESWGSNSLSFR